MSTIVAIKTVGDWRKQVDVKMKDVLGATMETTGRSLAQITKQAIILMARSARTLTKQSPKKRKLRKDSHGEYITIYKEDESASSLYKFRFLEKKATQLATWGHNRGMLKGTWEQAQIIKNRGLAKRSWFFSLPDVFGGEKARKPMRGVGYLKKILTDKVGGFILVNRLDYLPKILPAGWLQVVENNVKKQLLYKAEQKLLRQWGETAMRQWGYTGPGLARRTKPDLGKYMRAA